MSVSIENRKWNMEENKKKKVKKALEKSCTKYKLQGPIQFSYLMNVSIMTLSYKARCGTSRIQCFHINYSSFLLLLLSFSSFKFGFYIKIYSPSDVFDFSKKKKKKCRKHRRSRSLRGSDVE